MRWLRAWGQLLRGHQAADPWDSDPRIRAERASQHQRINRATVLLAHEGMAIRKERRFWERHGLPPEKQHDGA